MVVGVRVGLEVVTVVVVVIVVVVEKMAMMTKPADNLLHFTYHLDFIV